MTHPPSHEIEAVALNDLPQFWRGRANSLRRISAEARVFDNEALGVADTYDRCAMDLRAAILALNSLRGDADKVSDGESAR